eukprot:6197703-Pleurochrysis_carterae.AAC.2
MCGPVLHMFLARLPCSLPSLLAQAYSLPPHPAHHVRTPLCPQLATPPHSRKQALCARQRPRAPTGPPSRSARSAQRATARSIARTAHATRATPGCQHAPPP